MTRPLTSLLIGLCLFALGCGSGSDPGLYLDVWEESGGTAQSVALVVHPSGDVFVLGVHFEDHHSGIFLSRYTPEGRLRWRQLFREPQAQGLRGWDLAVDGNGDLLIAGEVFWGHLLGQIEYGEGDAVLYKVSPEYGSIIWRRQFGSIYRDTLKAVVADAAGNVFVTGTSMGDVREGLVHDRVSRAFLLGLDADGERLWLQQPDLGRPVASEGRSIALVEDRDLYFVINDHHTVDDDVGSATTVRRRATDGWRYWRMEWPLEGKDAGEAVAGDADGNLIVAGRSGGTAADDGYYCSQGYDIYVSKIDPDRTPIWTRTWDSRGCDSAYALAVDEADQIFVVGTTSGDLDTVRNTSGMSPFLIKLRPDGTRAWTRLFGHESRGTGKDLALGADGRAYLTGEIEVFFDGEEFPRFCPYLLTVDRAQFEAAPERLVSTEIQHTLVR